MRVKADAINGKCSADSFGELSRGLAQNNNSDPRSGHREAFRESRTRQFDPKRCLKNMGREGEKADFG